MADSDEPATGTAKVVVVNMYDDGVLKAIDSVSVYGIQDGEDAITVIMTNEAHALPTTDAGASGYQNSGTDIKVFRGSTPIPYGSGASTFSIATPNDTNITVGAASTVSTYIRRFANASSITSDTASIEFTITVRNTLNTATTFTKVQTLNRTRDGAVGDDAYTVLLTNDNTSVIANSSGSVTSYAGSGTEVIVYRGITKLSGLASNGTPNPSQYKVTIETNDPHIAESSTHGTLNSDNNIVFADHSSVSGQQTWGGNNTALLDYTITVRPSGGSDINFIRTQTLTKSIAGATGATGADANGVPYGLEIEFTGDASAATGSSGQTALDNAFLANDVVHVSAMSELSPEGIWVVKFVSSAGTDSIRRYNAFGSTRNSIAADSWSAHSTTIPDNLAVDGNIIALGTITSDRVETNFIDAFNIDAGNITSGSISVDRLSIDGQVEFEEKGAYWVGMQYPMSGNGFYLGNPEGSIAYTLAYEAGSGSTRKAFEVSDTKFEMYNPTIYTGTSTSTTQNAGSGNIVIPAAAVSITITTIGGGGGGGGSQSDTYDNDINGVVGGTGGETTASFTATGVGSVSISAAGGAGGANGSRAVSGGDSGGDSSAYGTGGTVGNTSATPTSAVGGNASGYGAGGGGGGGRPYGGWFNAGQDSTNPGEGGDVGSVVVRTYDVSAQTSDFNIAVNDGIGGPIGDGNVSNGGTGSPGRVYVTHIINSAKEVHLTTTDFVFNTVGSYAFANSTLNTTQSAGTTVAGSYLRATNARASSATYLAANSGDNAMTGTWRRMGYVIDPYDDGQTTLFIKIA